MSLEVVFAMLLDSPINPWTNFPFSPNTVQICYPEISDCLNSQPTLHFDDFGGANRKVNLLTHQSHILQMNLV